MSNKESCNCWRTIGKPSKGYCAGTKDLEYCDCMGDQSKCDFYADVRARALGTFESEKEAAIVKLQRLGVLDEECQIVEEFRNILMKK